MPLSCLDFPITFVFVALLLVTTLLINELERSITFAQQERTGVQLIREVEVLIHLAQQSATAVLAATPQHSSVRTKHRLAVSNGRPQQWEEF